MENFATFFKTVVYFKIRPDGTQYTEDEIRLNLNRRWMGSFDTRTGKFKTKIHDAESSFVKCEKQLSTLYKDRYKTGIVFINNYKGFDVACLKYVDGIKKFGMRINYFKKNVDKEDVYIYSVPSADELIKMYYANLLSDAQKKLIRPVDNQIPTALPYYGGKLSDKLNNLRT